MSPDRKRRIRFFSALGAAVVLAFALVWTSMGGASPVSTPSDLLASATPGKTYQLTGKVADGSVRDRGSTLRFRVRDRAGSGSVPVAYSGEVPDPFREGREVVVDVRREGTGFVGVRDSLVTKCPSKFSADDPSGQ